MDKINGLRARNSDPEKHKLTFDRLVKKYGCDMLLVTPLIDTIVDGNEVKGIVVHTKKGKTAILGKTFVDASGDSDLVYFAGGETMTGREEDGMSMGCSLEFVLGGVDFDTYYNSDLNKNDPKWYKFIPEQLEKGNLPYEIDNHLNWLTHIPDRPEHCGMDEAQYEKCNIGRKRKIKKHPRSENFADVFCIPHLIYEKTTESILEDLM